jgi:hypothetical protein
VSVLALPLEDGTPTRGQVGSHLRCDNGPCRNLVWILLQQRSPGGSRSVTGRAPHGAKRLNNVPRDVGEAQRPYREQSQSAPVPTIRGMREEPRHQS